MKKIWSVILMVMVLCAAAAGAEEAALKDLAAEKGFRIGICLSPENLQDEKYLAFLSTEFNTTTCTNETKAYSLLNQWMSQNSEDGMPRMNYTTADKMIAWAQENGLHVRGHVLTWDAYMVEWFFHEGYDVNQPIASREVILQRMESYITQVMTHFEENFPGVIDCWDVVNEAIGDSASEWDASDERHLRTMRSGSANMFYEYVGSDYVEYSFLYARNCAESLGAEIRLFYNDYNMVYPERRKAALALVESINHFDKDEKGEWRKLIDGVGLQGYLGGYGNQSGCLEKSLITTSHDAILEYAENGLEVHFTEMALRNYDETKIQEHAQFYHDFFEMLAGVNSEMERSMLTSVTIWGVKDVTPNSWNTYVWKLNGTYSGILTEDGEIKDAFVQMKEAFN